MASSSHILRMVATSSLTFVRLRRVPRHATCIWTRKAMLHMGTPCLAGARLLCPVPVMGLDAALTQYGSLPRSVVMAPAVHLARDGFELTEYDTDILRRGTARFRRDANASRIFLHSDASPLQPGDRLVQPQLAATLASIAADGPNAFYRGRIPEAIRDSSACRGRHYHGD